MRISDWSSDVCSSDLGLDVLDQSFQPRPIERAAREPAVIIAFAHADPAFGALAGDIGLAGLALGIEAVELHVQPFLEIGRASCRERVCQYVKISVGAV